MKPLTRRERFVDWLSGGKITRMQEATEAIRRASDRAADNARAERDTAVDFACQTSDAARKLAKAASVCEGIRPESKSGVFYVPQFPVRVEFDPDAPLTRATMPQASACRMIDVACEMSFCLVPHMPFALMADAEVFPSDGLEPLKRRTMQLKAAMLLVLMAKHIESALALAEESAAKATR